MASTSTSDEKKMVTLKSEDGELFEVEEAVAVQAQSIKHVVEDGCADDNIPVPNVNSSTLSKVLEYCKMHREDNPEDKETLEEFDTKFMDLDQEGLYHLIVAANYLNVKGLLDACCQKAADMIKGKTPEQIRETFNIKNDFTPEEEEKIKRDHQWAFE